MWPSFDHETLKKTLGRLIETYADERGIDLIGCGSHLRAAILNAWQRSGQSGTETGPIGGEDRGGDNIGDASVGWGVLSATDEHVGIGWGT